MQTKAIILGALVTTSLGCDRDPPKPAATFCCGAVHPTGRGYGTDCTPITDNSRDCAKRISCTAGYMFDDGEAVCLGPE